MLLCVLSTTVHFCQKRRKPFSASDIAQRHRARSNNLVTSNSLPKVDDSYLSVCRSVCLASGSKTTTTQRNATEQWRAIFQRPLPTTSIPIRFQSIIPVYHIQYSISLVKMAVLPKIISNKTVLSSG
jgi:hypothetical protein